MKGKRIECVAFILILGFVFLKVTYLFRNADHHRNTVTGIKEEECQIDVLLTGGSEIMVYYEPLKAYSEYGITSYNMSTDALPADAIKYYIGQTLKYQEPKVVVVGLRTLAYWSEDIYEGYLRNASDSLDFGIERIRLLNEYFSRRKGSLAGIDLGSYYFDIAYYHTHQDVLGYEQNWKYLGNSSYSVSKGFLWEPYWQKAERPADFMADGKAQLDAGRKEVLVDLLDYCKEKGLDVLFVVSPYVVSADDERLFGAMEDIIREYGFGYLDANRYYDEMGLDFGRDFYNDHHVNPYGAEKFTLFLSKYLTDNYGIKDRRGEPGLEKWEQDMQVFLNEEEAVKKTIDALIDDVADAPLDGTADVS